MWDSIHPPLGKNNMFWRLLFILSASHPLSPSLFPFLSQCMCLSWLSFFREMPVYSFVNMTDIMSFLIHHQAQIKTLFWVYTVKIHFFSSLVFNLVGSFFFHSIFLFSWFSSVWRDNHIAKHTRPSRTTLSLLNTHSQTATYCDWWQISHEGHFFIYWLCLWFISKDICHPGRIEMRTVWVKHTKICESCVILP